MSDPSKPPSLDDLGNRISKARRTAGLEPEDEADTDRAVGAGLAMAWRISIEIVVAVVVCAVVGWGLDSLFGTTPWLMLLGLVLGGAAGINNAVRAMLRMEADAARRQQEADEAKAKPTGPADAAATEKRGD